MADPLHIYENLLMATGSPPKALRMVRAEYPHFTPSPRARPVIKPRAVPVEASGDPTVLAKDVRHKNAMATSVENLWKVIHSEHPDMMRKLHKHGEDMRALGKHPAPVVVYP